MSRLSRCNLFCSVFLSASVMMGQVSTALAPCFELDKALHRMFFLKIVAQEHFAAQIDPSPRGNIPSSYGRIGDHYRAEVMRRWDLTSVQDQDLMMEYHNHLQPQYQKVQSLATEALATQATINARIEQAKKDKDPKQVAAIRAERDAMLVDRGNRLQQQFPKVYSHVMAELRANIVCSSSGEKR